MLGTMTPRDLITRYLAAARAGDWETAFGFFADDLVARIPGRGPFAGEHRGREAAIEYITSVRERYGEEAIELELIDMLASDERVALLLVERFHRDDGPLEIRRANVYRVAGDRITEVTIFEADQDTVDELLH